jgi:hypothetical protein
MYIREGASLDVTHLNGESIVFNVEVSWFGFDKYD